MILQLEQQAMKIQDIMYNSKTKHTFDRVSGFVDRDSDAVDSDLDEVNTNTMKQTYDDDRDTNIGSMKHDQNTKTVSKNIDTQDKVQNARCENKMTYVKWSTEMNQTDSQYSRDYYNT